MAAPLEHLNARLICCSVVLYFSKITAVVLEEFIKRFKKNSAFEALLIETICTSAKSNT